MRKTGRKSIINRRKISKRAVFYGNIPPPAIQKQNS